MKKVTTIAKSKNMIKFWLLCFMFVIVGLRGTSVFALDLMGPPTTNLQQSQFQTAIGYSQSSMELQLVNGTWSRYVVGDYFESGDFFVDYEIKDFKETKMYSYFSYSFINNWEAFIRIADRAFA